MDKSLSINFFTMFDVCLTLLALQISTLNPDINHSKSMAVYIVTIINYEHCCCLITEGWNIILALEKMLYYNARKLIRKLRMEVYLIPHM